jgi:hypothetical protein
MTPEPNTEDAALQARRKFLATCGKFALVTPPVITLMLSDAERNFAVAASGGSIGHGGGGGHHGGGLFDLLEDLLGGHHHGH